MRRSVFAVVALLIGIFTTRPLSATPIDTANTSTVTFAKATQIPGETLKPGTYSVKVLDHLTDRMIVRIEDSTGKIHTVFLAVPGPALSSGATTGPIIWHTKLNGAAALRGFKFPSGYTVEFVYPKAEAAVLAKANEGKVLAVDPDSEGRPTLPHMNSEDLQMVHLWMLSLTTASPDGKTPAILAQAYQPPAQSQSVQVASNSIPDPPRISAQRRVAESRTTTPAPASSAPRKHPAMAALPHTASSLPMLVLAAFAALFAAMLIRMRLLHDRSS